MLKLFWKKEILVLHIYMPVDIGVFRVGQMGATHPPKVSHPCAGLGAKKIVFLHLFIPMTLPRTYFLM